MSCFRLALVIFLIPIPVTAATSTWGSTPPSWAAQEPTPPRSTTKRTRVSSSDVSPFSPNSNNIALELGQVFLMGDMGDRADSAIGTAVHYTYGVSDLFGFDSSIGYSEHSDGRLSMITALMGVRTNLAWYDRVIPHAVFGMGFYKPSYQVSQTNPKGEIIPGSTTSVSSLLFGVHLGPGVDLALSKQVFFGASLTFHDIFGNSQIVNGQPFNMGGTFTTFLIHGGVSF